MATTVSECVDALRRAADELGESPTKAQYEELGMTPASATIIRTIGNWNEAKTKAGLETSPSRGSRLQPKPPDIDIPDDAEWDEMSVDQRWHSRNREWNTQRSLNRRQRLRAWVFEYKTELGGCARCSENDPVCLDFHHIISEEKEMGIGQMITYGYGKQRLKNEIRKCIVLCANCHRKEHDHRPEVVEKR